MTQQLVQASVAIHAVVAIVVAQLQAPAIGGDAAPLEAAARIFGAGKGHQTVVDRTPRQARPITEIAALAKRPVNAHAAHWRAVEKAHGAYTQIGLEPQRRHFPAQRQTHAAVFLTPGRAIEVAQGRIQRVSIWLGGKQVLYGGHLHVVGPAKAGLGRVFHRAGIERNRGHAQGDTVIPTGRLISSGVSTSVILLRPDSLSLVRMVTP